MASIRKRGNKYCIIYSYRDQEGKKKQKWETVQDKAEALKRKKEVEYKMSVGDFVVPQCKSLKELFNEYVELYGKDKWSASTYEGNNGLFRNYIEPVIGSTKIADINTRFIEVFYQQLLKTPAVKSPSSKRNENKTVTLSAIRDIHKLLRSCFEQAVKWELMEKNPCIYATVPKYKAKPREIWTAETLMKATELCDDDILRLAMNLSFSASLRIGEVTGLTWDCVDISPEAMENGSPSVTINKQYQRISLEAFKQLDGKDVVQVFPPESKLCKTVRVLKSTKTESSNRKVFLPKTVAEMLIQHKKDQEEVIYLLGDEYHDYNLVLTTSSGMPIGEAAIRKKFNKLIEDHDLPKVVFHSLRHSSVTYKLKLNGGDIKAVQGDSGHSQVSMVTDVYSHIIDEDRRKNAELFEEAFYGKQNLNPQMRGDEHNPGNTVKVPEGVDPEVLAKVLSNPEMMTLLTSLAKTMQQ